MQRAAGKLWVFKPKFHLFQGGNLGLLWTYRDEDFGGSIAHTARRRGGFDQVFVAAVPQWLSEYMPCFCCFSLLPFLQISFACCSSRPIRSEDLRIEPQWGGAAVSGPPLRRHQLCDQSCYSFQYNTPPVRRYSNIYVSFVEIQQYIYISFEEIQQYIYIYVDGYPKMLEEEVANSDGEVAGTSDGETSEGEGTAKEPPPQNLDQSALEESPPPCLKKNGGRWLARGLLLLR